MKKYDIAMPIIFLVIAGLIIKNSLSMGDAVDGTSMGPGVWPIILSCGLIILSLILLIRTLIRKQHAEDPIDFKSEGMKRVYITVGILAGFVLLLKLFGFYVAAAVVMPAFMILLKERRPWLIAAITGGMLLFVFVVFGILLHVKLPHGILF